VTRTPPRRHHQAFKYRVHREALADGGRFAVTFAAPDGAARLAELWDAVGAELPPEERLPADGLALTCKGEPASPVVIVTMPAPLNANEAYYHLAIPAAAEGLVFRFFALEKAVFPKTGEPLVFAVEMRRDARDNYGPPSDDRPNDPHFGLFCGAVLDICDGKRKPYATTPL
jgi:hypothetical protein